MFKRTKGFIRGFICGALIFALAGAATAAVQVITQTIQVSYSGIKIYVDGNLITPKDSNGNIVEPFAYNGTTYLPIRAISEALGKTPEWDSTTQSVYIGPKPGSTQYMTDVVPAYDFDYYRYFEFSSINGSTNDRVWTNSVRNLISFSMAGTKYYNGCVWNPFNGVTPFSIYNLNGEYSRIMGTLAHIDKSGMNDATLLVYYDGVLNQSIELTSDMLPQAIELDVRGVLQLKIEIVPERNGDFAYGFGNPTIQ
jgi:hypothetical protein